MYVSERRVDCYIDGKVVELTLAVELLAVPVKSISNQSKKANNNFIGAMTTHNRFSVYVRLMNLLIHGEFGYMYISCVMRDELQWKNENYVRMLAIR